MQRVDVLQGRADLHVKWRRSLRHEASGEQPQMPISQLEEREVTRPVVDQDSTWESSVEVARPLHICHVKGQARK